MWQLQPLDAPNRLEKDFGQQKNFFEQLGSNLKGYVFSDLACFRKRTVIPDLRSLELKQKAYLRLYKRRCLREIHRTGIIPVKLF